MPRRPEVQLEIDTKTTAYRARALLMGVVEAGRYQRQRGITAERVEHFRQRQEATSRPTGLHPEPATDAMTQTPFPATDAVDAQGAPESDTLSGRQPHSSSRRGESTPPPAPHNNNPTSLSSAEEAAQDAAAPDTAARSTRSGLRVTPLILTPRKTRLLAEDIDVLLCDAKKKGELDRAYQHAVSEINELQLWQNPFPFLGGAVEDH